MDAEEFSEVNQSEGSGLFGDFDEHQALPEQLQVGGDNDAAFLPRSRPSVVQDINHAEKTQTRPPKRLFSLQTTLPPKARETDQVFAMMPSDFSSFSGSTVSETSEVKRKRSLNVGAVPVRKRRSLSSSTSEMSTLPDASSIQCTTIPDQFNEKEILRQHFSKFGKVIRVQCNARKKSATVRFSTHEHAAAAKAKGKHLHGNMIHIYFLKKVQSSERMDKSVLGSTTKQSERPQTLTPQMGTAAKVALRRTSRNKQQALISCVKTRSVSATTDEEKLQLLEKIDKNLRSRLVKQSDLSKATVTTGTCPDMCPEKERYLRQQRNLLSVYEMKDHKKMDHARMVKEYSRSSADQEEPLPHELRPPKVLRITMDYMLTHMMRDVDHEKTAEWYDFVWNRTRAIRKEISIQQANDDFAIEVTEECARFHICCGHELCEADVLNFDPKINNENLEKTMKTVLDMYDDARAKNGDEEDVFKNEPEFRAYFVLLNINRSSDVLRELQNMSLGVRYSPEVKLAVSAFAAMQSKNFSSFFNVVRRASYLQAALLHRYFAQIRRQAVMVMAKAYKSQKGVCLVPAHDVMRKLRFNDDSELSEFCNSLDIPIRDGNLQLRKAEEYNSDGLAMFCSHEIRFKMEGRCLGDVISHNRTPISQLHEPYSSFDHEGRYIGLHAHLLSTTVYPTKPATNEVPDKKTDLVKFLSVKRRISNNVVKMIAKDLFNDVITEIVGNLGKEVVDAALPYLVTDNVSTDILEEFITKEMKQLVSNILLEKKLEEQRKQEEAEEKARKIKEETERRLREQQEKEEAMRRRIEKKEAINRSVCNIALELEKEVVDDIILTTAVAVTREEWLDCTADVVFREVLDCSVDEMVHDMSLSVMKEAIKQKHDKLRQTLRTTLTGIRWRKWRKELVKIRKRRLACETFPSAPFPRTLQGQVQDLLQSSRRDHVDELGVAKVDERVNHRLSMEPLSRLLRRHADATGNVEKEVLRFESSCFDRLPLTEIAFTNISCDETEEESTKTFWKISLACSLASQRSFWTTWLTYKLGLREKEDEECPTDVSFEAVFASPSAVRHHVHVCCKMLDGRADVASSVVGTSAFVVLVTRDDLDKWQNLQGLLKNIFSSTPHDPSVPLLILHHDCNFNDQELIEELHIPAWHHVISPVRVVAMSDDVRSNGQLLSSNLQWLAAQTNPAPSLRYASLRDVIEEQLSIHFLSPLCRHEAMRTKHMFPSLDPCTLVEMHNDILDQVEAVITDEVLMDVSWPAEEYRSMLHSDAQAMLPAKGWNSEMKFQEISDVITSLKLPLFPAIKQHQQIEDLLQASAQFCYSVCGVASQVASVISNMTAFCHSNECLDLEEFLQAYPWQKLINTVSGLLFQNVLYTKRGDEVVAFYDSSVANIQLDVKFRDLFHHVEVENLASKESESKPNVRLSVGATSAVDLEARSDSEENLLQASSQETVRDISSWIIDNDVSEETANQVAGLRMNIRNEAAESKRFVQELEKQIEEESHFLNMLFTS